MMAPVSRNAVRSPDFDAYLLTDRNRYRLLQLAHGDNVIILNDEGLIRYASSSAVRNLGRSHQRDLVGEPLLSLLHRSDMLNTRVMLERLTVGRAPALEWVTRLRADHRWEWFKVRATRFAYESEATMITAIFLAPLRRV